MACRLAPLVIATAMRRQATEVRSASVAACPESAARSCSAVVGSPVRNAHSARWKESANASAFVLSQRSGREIRLSGDEVVQGGCIGGCGLGSLAGDQIEGGELIELVLGIDQRGGTIELIDDLEGLVLAQVGGRLGHERSADLQMQGGELGSIDQCVGGFLNSIVGEHIVTIDAKEQTGAYHIQQLIVDIGLRLAEQPGQRIALRGVSQAGKTLERLLRVGLATALSGRS